MVCMDFGGDHDTFAVFACIFRIGHRRFMHLEAIERIEQLVMAL
jgi:hypothetical protein